MDPVEIIGLLAGALGLSIAAPQAIRIRKLGTFGVSRTTWMLMYASFCCWVGYGIREASVSQAVTNGIGILLGAWLLVALLHGERWRWPFIIAIPIAGPLLIIFVPLTAMWVVLLAFSATRWPQVFRSWQAWRDKTPIPAVSILTWMLNLGSATLWLTYGVADQRLLVMTTSALSITASVLIISFTRLANAQPPASRPPHNSDA